MLNRREFLGVGGAVLTGLIFPSTLFGEDGKEAVEEKDFALEKARRISAPNYRMTDDGTLIFNSNGFILGDRYYTVYHGIHNLTTGKQLRNPIIYGKPSEIIAASARNDVALFGIPEELKRYYNDCDFNRNFNIDKNQEILIYGIHPEWLSTAGERILRGIITDVSCSVFNHYLKCNVSGYACFEGNVDFGDSGSVVLDAKSGEPLGIVTNKERDNSGYGYFAPMWKFALLLDDL